MTISSSLSGDAILAEGGLRASVISVRMFSECRSLTLVFVPASIRVLCEFCFSACRSLSTVIFEANSKLDRIEQWAWSECSSLKSLCIPSSVTVICLLCCGWCTSLSSLTFESDSRLDRIGTAAFYGCSSLESICLPCSLRVIDGSAFTASGISAITVANGNSYFSVCDDFLLDFAGVYVIRYCGLASDVTISYQIERLCCGWFGQCQSI
jgi:hypothetical protein